MPVIPVDAQLGGVVAFAVTGRVGGGEGAAVLEHCDCDVCGSFGQWMCGYLTVCCAGWDLPNCWAPAFMRACFPAEVADGSSHWKGSPSAALGSREEGRAVGMERAERARVARRVAMVSLGVMVGYL